MPFFVYILQCADKTLYTGCTNNLEKRIKEHNTSKNGAHYTKIRRPVMLKYYEEYSTLLEARGREAEIKRMEKGEKERVMLAVSSISPKRNALTKAILDKPE